MGHWEMRNYGIAKRDRIGVLFPVSSVSIAVFKLIKFVSNIKNILPSFVINYSTLCPQSYDVHSFPHFP
jgi:hypothetical protein